MRASLKPLNPIVLWCSDRFQGPQWCRKSDGFTFDHYHISCLRAYDACSTTGFRCHKGLMERIFECDKNVIMLMQALIHLSVCSLISGTLLPEIIVVNYPSPKVLLIHSSLECVWWFFLALSNPVLADCCQASPRGCISFQP